MGAGSLWCLCGVFFSNGKKEEEEELAPFARRNSCCINNNRKLFPLAGPDGHQLSRQ